MDPIKAQGIIGTGVAKAYKSPLSPPDGQIDNGYAAPPIRAITADQVAWMMGAIYRYIPPDAAHPRCSVERDMKAYGLLYEIMEAANLRFADHVAMSNATPQQVRPEVKLPTSRPGE